MTKKLKIFMHSLSATGHINSTIGIGQELLKRQHEIVFAVDFTIKEHLESFGFRVLPLVPSVQMNPGDNPAKMFADVFLANGFFSNKSTYEKTAMFCDHSPTSPIGVMLNQMIDFDSQLEKYIRDEQPDVILYDQFFYFPCLSKFSIPWIKIMSCQPSCFLLDNPELPPPLSGYTQADREKFPAFRAMLKEKVVDYFAECQHKINEARNFQPSGKEYIPNLYYSLSPYLNIYQYPEELNYPENELTKYPMICVDTFVRDEINETFKLEPNFMPSKPGEKLIFLTMGSMGAIDLRLMKRLISILSRLPHKFIVSKGPLGDELELAANMWGANSVPQTKVLPLVDLVITHGGNNTVCEAFHFGKPMIVMGLFGDQFDNAQRIQDTGFGLRLEPYDFDDKQLVESIEKLLNDRELYQRLQNARNRMLKDNKKTQLCDLIEETVQNFSKN